MYQREKPLLLMLTGTCLWLWLYAFVHPKTGETYWWILPYVNTELFNKVLADFARQFNLGVDKHILLTSVRVKQNAANYGW